MVNRLPKENKMKVIQIEYMNLIVCDEDIGPLCQILSRTSCADVIYSKDYMRSGINNVRLVRFEFSDKPMYDQSWDEEEEVADDSPTS
jgi:hypothetical protein